MELKDIAELFSAFLTPIIAIIATYIAIQQYRTSKRKTKLDLFEKRFAVYEGVKELILHVRSKANVENHAFNAFNAKTADSFFLFGDNVTEYIDELRSKASQIKSVAGRLSDRSLKVGEERNKLAKEMTELENWFGKQFKHSQKEFSKYLRMKS